VCAEISDVRSATSRVASSGQADVDAQPKHVAGPGQGLGRDDQPAADRPAAAIDAATPDRLAGELLLEVEGDGALALGDGDHGVDLARHALLPREVPLPAGEQLGDGPAVGVVDGAGAQLQEPQAKVQRRGTLPVDTMTFQQHLGAGAVRLVGEPGRGQDAELPAEPVLLGGGAVGVEQVPLEQDGVGEGGDLVERGIPRAGGVADHGGGRGLRRGGSRVTLLPLNVSSVTLLTSGPRARARGPRRAHRASFSSRSTASSHVGSTRSER
jgi:hypothetical protein